MKFSASQFLSLKPHTSKCGLLTWRFGILVDLRKVADPHTVIEWWVFMEADWANSQMKFKHLSLVQKARHPQIPAN